MNEVVFVGQGDGIGWAEMINGEQKNVKGDSGQKTILRNSNPVTKRGGVWAKVPQSNYFVKKSL